MGINSQITAAAILTLAIAGCTIGGDTSTTQPTNTSQTTPAKPDTKIATQPDPVSTDNPIFAPKNPGLIESTQADVRIKGVQQGRQDPFGEIVKNSPGSITSVGMNQKPVPIPPPLPVTPIGSSGQRGQIRTPVQPGQIRTPVRTGQGSINASLPKPKPAVTPVLPTVLPQVVTPKKLEPVLPELPKPETAEAVYVSGVVLIGKQPKAIIKVPKENTSRYVQAGQRLADGVLVKRIEMNGGSDPIVVFEQYGIEVAKAVGEEPKSESKTASAGNSIAMTTPL
ncbi:hypothetical protein WJM97_02635 [Okeanomitos corallinicola TIOX110]|uniref:Uncharacterized protein n=1 Tax=Okeanomitos corallinicola TIOX110 TaxID=3133117 RepID=A0ABZ2UU20_9CYAN